ncbi:unnamed protein product [Ectocarpus sp. 13 AM-2016]
MTANKVSIERNRELDGSLLHYHPFLVDALKLLPFFLSCQHSYPNHITSCPTSPILHSLVAHREKDKIFALSRVHRLPCSEMLRLAYAPNVSHRCSGEQKTLAYKVCTTFTRFRALFCIPLVYPYPCALAIPDSTPPPSHKHTERMPVCNLPVGVAPPFLTADDEMPLSFSFEEWNDDDDMPLSFSFEE